MDASDVRYIVEQAVRNARDEMQNEIDRLTNELAILYCRLERLEESEHTHVHA